MTLWPVLAAEHRGAARAGVGGAARGHVGKSVRIPVSLAERSGQWSSRSRSMIVSAA